MRTQLIILLASLAVVAARPKHEGAHAAQQIDLRDAVNKTVCPISVELNIEEGRVPKIIKFIKCNNKAIAASPNCCHTHKHGERAHCTELRDDVLVQYPNGTRWSDFKPTYMKVNMPVGCVCLRQVYSSGNTTPDPELLR